MFRLRAYVGDDECPQGVAKLIYDGNIHYNLIYLNGNRG
jgi:hypothetical protein